MKINDKMLSPRDAGKRPPATRQAPGVQRETTPARADSRCRCAVRRTPQPSYADITGVPLYMHTCACYALSWERLH